MVAGMPGGVMVSDLEGEGEQRGFGTGACALRHLHASCGSLSLSLGGQDGSAGAPPIVYLHNHMERFTMLCGEDG